MAPTFRGRRRVEIKLGKMRKAGVDAAFRSLHRGGLAVERTMVEKIATITTGYKQVPSRGDSNKLHWVSAPGQAPNADIGELHQSITTIPIKSRLRVEVGANTPYAEALELGTEKMAPRPFARPSLAENEEQIRRNVRRDVRIALRREARKGRGGR